MEEFLPILIILIGAISSWMKKSKKSTQQKQQLEARKQAVQQAAHRQMEQQKTVMPMPEIPRQPIMPSLSSHVSNEFAPAPAQMGEEGEDDCHEYMLDEPAAVPKAPAAQDHDSEEIARELVRGVIIGEILRRPVHRNYGRQA